MPGELPGLEFRFLLLPENSDPDELFREQGSKALELLRQNAKSAIELAVSEYLPEDRLPTTTEKKAALDKVYDLLDHVSSQIAKEDYITIAAKLLKVMENEDLHEHLVALKQRKSNVRRKSIKPTRELNQDALLTDGTWEVLWLILHFPEYSKRISEIIDYEWIDKESQAGSFLQRIIAEIRENLIQDSSEIEHLVENIEDRMLLADLHSKDLEIDSAEKNINTYLNYMYRNYLSNQLKTLKQQVAEASPENQRLLMRKVIEVRNKLAHPHELKI